MTSRVPPVAQISLCLLGAVGLPRVRGLALTPLPFAVGSRWSNDVAAGDTFPFPTRS